ncbi:beta-1,4-N-acetylgalactosaminyltransferase bre-4-like isoform X2 [Vespa velutina]|uniref:beta-1,4-N-acetylgalactosaminyltransferase bre-4-like isoform X2 n=1 Tax=Vespa velutina TaxID=202808 RepID=UPI001FB26527|nr:beta-1,4-N-acetylgalactosaminyltransferase bre-4-like isoform X2 [Vespa velutina]
MTVAAAVALWHRANLYKAMACVVLALIAVQYLLSGVLDRRSIETIFTINATRYADRTYRNHPRGLIIYGPATVSSIFKGHNNNNNNNNNNNVTSKIFPSAGKGDNGGSGLANITKTEAGIFPTNNVVGLSPGSSPQYVSNATNNATIQQCPLVSPNLGTGAFNRAMLMNVGYVEALKERTFDCFIFHDVDLLPEDDRNLYTCPEQPRHMSVAVDKFRYKLPYADLFGGVSAMSREHFKLVNGFSNVFWGWGGEDDDMANRIKAHGLHISRYPANVARYKMLTHKKEKANPKRYEFLRTGKKRFATDGLSNLQYELIDKQKPKLYTWLLVRLTPPQPS